MPFKIASYGCSPSFQGCAVFTVAISQSVQLNLATAGFLVIEMEEHHQWYIQIFKKLVSKDRMAHSLYLALRRGERKNLGMHICTMC